MATAYIALGSNVGDRHSNLLRAYRGLREHGIGRVITTSGLYETEPQYVADQPSFLNAALQLDTDLQPMPLLRALKSLEEEIGRTDGQRWGPRVVDLDILLYGDAVLTDDSEPGRHLTVPHPMMHERDFVLQPLADIAPQVVHPTLHATIAELWHSLQTSTRSTSTNTQNTRAPVRVLPMGRSSDGTELLWDMQSVTRVMGILNVTPDSFSDGGQYSSSVATAVQHALAMVADGADIIDIGGESTRRASQYHDFSALYAAIVYNHKCNQPAGVTCDYNRTASQAKQALATTPPGAADVSEAEELQRVVPVIQALRSTGCTVPISIDTRRAAVALAAVSAGASIVNDVSAGTHDAAMLPALATAAELQGVPYIAMHMRGTPATMTSCTKYANDVVSDVITELARQLAAAEAAGVPRWLLVCDPGVGFAKTAAQSLQLMTQLQRISTELHCPLLIGPSRK
eukprot:16031-Heterococcus_DN1.PRE.1